jgi:hypothetical protein
MFVIGFLINYWAICFFELAKLIITLQNYINLIDISQILKLLFLLGIFSYLNKALLNNKILIFTSLGSAILFNIYYTI